MRYRNFVKNPRTALRVAGAICAVAGAAMASQAFAACTQPHNFPRRPLTILVPYGPSGGSAQVSLAMAKAVADATHNKIHVEVQYKPGGVGVLGVRTYMSLPADGYTILEQTDGAATNYASGVTPVNPVTSFTPLLIAQLVYNQIYISPQDKRYQNWKEFVAYAKAHPGKVRIANIANRGAMESIDMARLAKAAGIDVVTVSYNKPAKRYAAMVGRHVDALFEQPGDVKGFITSGDFKPILTLLPHRPSTFSHVPALDDVGIHTSFLNRYRGFVVNKDVPSDRKAWLECTFQEAWHQPSFQNFNNSHWVYPGSFKDSENAMKLIKYSVGMYQKVDKELGIIKH